MSPKEEIKQTIALLKTVEIGQIKPKKLTLKYETQDGSIGSEMKPGFCGIMKKMNAGLLFNLKNMSSETIEVRF